MMDEETFDYGLDPGESFIPDDIDDIDPAAPHIMTVLGPVAPGALGVTNASASLIRLPNTNDEALLTELEEAGFAGIGAFVARDPIRTAEDLAPIRWLAERSNQHFIYGYQIPTLAEFDAELQAVIDVARSGLGDAGAQPGFIAARLEQLSVAAVVRERLGLPAIVELGPDEVDALLSTAPDELEGVIARIPGEIDLAPLQNLAEAGAFLLFDDLTGDPEQDLPAAQRIAGLAGSGFLQSLLLGYHPHSAPESVSYGVGSRWSYLIEQFPLLVLDAGLDAMAMRTILIENPNEAFAIHPPQALDE